MKKKMLSLLLAAIVVLSMPTALFAAETTEAKADAEALTVSNDEGIAPMSTTTADVGASRISSTKGSVSAYGSFDVKASKAVCTIILQEKYNGSWRTATGLSVTSYTKTSYDTYAISTSKTFTLKSGKVYRAKIIFTDKNSSGSHSKTYYTGSF